MSDFMLRHRQRWSCRYLQSRIGCLTSSFFSNDKCIRLLMHDHYQWLNSTLMRSHLTELKGQSVLLLGLQYGGGKKYDSLYEGEIVSNESCSPHTGPWGKVPAGIKKTWFLFRTPFFALITIAGKLQQYSQNTVFNGVDTLSSLGLTTNPLS